MGAAALLASTALPGLAQDQVISWIYCGDTLDPVHIKYIAEWEAANEGWKVEPELVGWAQCQDKATTLAAAGSPPALAYVGSRTLKEFSANGLVVEIPMTDEEKAAYYPGIVETVTSDGTQWGVPIAFSTKALYWNKDLFEQAGLGQAGVDDLLDVVLALGQAVDARTIGDVVVDRLRERVGLLKHHADAGP